VWGELPLKVEFQGLKHGGDTVISMIRFTSFFIMNTVFQVLLRWVLAFGLLAGGVAMADSEPTMNQIYAAAQAGKLDDAQVMVQQVLITHPKSAKAHFVQAELFARRGSLDKARESLREAESLAPGLPFAKPEAVQALRAQFQTKQTTAVSAAPVQSHSSNNWVVPALLAAGAIAVGYLVFRRHTPQVVTPSNPHGAAVGQGEPGGWQGPQTFGQAGAPMQPGYAPGSQSTAYPAQPGLGSRIAGGVATGLAVGAGVVAAQAIARNLMDDDHPSAHPRADAFGSSNGLEPIGGGVNADMGGSNFGIADTAWDDGGSSSGGSDWDN